MKRNLMLTILLVFATLVMTACGTSSNVNSSNSSSAVNTNASSSPVSSNAPSATSNASALPAPEASALADLVKAEYEAYKKKDVNALKKLYSRFRLEMIQMQAEQSGKPVDKFILAIYENLPPTPPETRNPQVIDRDMDGKPDSDAAQIEVNYGDGWRKMVCIKEGGQWKIDSLTAPGKI